jgi:2-polyprenyl-3-methyl-5-hydroxy-6-metoxy-1,4-benzoquinol methylase
MIKNIYVINALFIIILFLMFLIFIKKKSIIKKVLKKVLIKIFYDKIRNFFSLIMDERVAKLEAMIDFLIYQNSKIHEKFRQDLLHNFNEKKSNAFSSHDLDSFNFQWTSHNQGNLLLSDKAFMADLETTICSYFDVDRKYFEGKKIIDVGAGSGRFTYGFLNLKAEVTAIEPTQGGCEEIKKSCKKFLNKLQVLQKNILLDELPKGFDMVFCFGVVHHTGNTYLAIKKVIECAKKDAKVFFMIYGYPNTKEDFQEVNFYEKLRLELRNKNFEDKINALSKNFPKNNVHTLFDASSPKENDLLRYEEVIEILSNFGIKNIKRTFLNRNLFLVGEKT